MPASDRKNALSRRACLENRPVGDRANKELRLKSNLVGRVPSRGILLQFETRSSFGELSNSPEGLRLGG